MDLQQSAGVDVVRIAVFDATERRRYEQELVRAKQRAEASEERARALARTLQSSFIPPSVPTVPGLDVAGAYRPAADGTVVGGDFYDVFPVTRDEWVVVLGDVCGKGAEAAVVTSFVRDTVRVLSVSERSPARVLGRLNELLLRHAGADRYSTCVLVRLDRRGAGWHATVSVGGHPPPVVLRRGGDPAFAPFRGLLVGALPGAAFTDHEILLEPGDGLLLYTDGITEARAGEGFFGEERLLATLRGVASDGVAMDDVVSHLVGEALAFQAGNAHDDIAAVGLRVSAEPDPSDQERPAGSSPGR
jgi:sigma-B regulation protein RsbU (phosphoserine phosphatase)